MAILTLLSKGTEASTEDFTMTGQTVGTGMRGLLILASSVNSSGSVDWTPTGAGVTWNQLGIGTVDYGSRRSLGVFLSSGTPTTGNLTITTTPTGTWQETLWMYLQISDYDSADVIPTGNQKTNATSGTSATIASFGAYETDDLGVLIVANEEATPAGFAFEGGMTYLTQQTGGGNVRSIHVGTTADDTSPSASWTPSASWGAIGFVIEHGTDGPSGGSSIIPQAMYHYRNNSGSGL